MASIFQGCRPELHHPLVEAGTVLDSMAARDCHKLCTYRISDYRGNLTKGGTPIPAKNQLGKGLPAEGVQWDSSLPGPGLPAGCIKTSSVRRADGTLDMDEP